MASHKVPPRPRHLVRATSTASYACDREQKGHAPGMSDTGLYNCVRTAQDFNVVDGREPSGSREKCELGHVYRQISRKLLRAARTGKF